MRKSDIEICEKLTFEPFSGSKPSQTKKFKKYFGLPTAYCGPTHAPSLTVGCGIVLVFEKNLVFNFSTNFIFVLGQTFLVQEQLCGIILLIIVNCFINCFCKVKKINNCQRIVLPGSLPIFSLTHSQTFGFWALGSWGFVRSFHTSLTLKGNLAAGVFPPLKPLLINQIDK